MKHGRRHSKLKEQAYIARKDAEGYGRAYRPIEVARPERPVAPPPPAELPLAAAMNKKAQRQLKRLGIMPIDSDEEA